MYGMKICVARQGEKLPPCDLALYGFGFLGEVDYESELKGQTDKFEEAARLSRANDCCAVCGCKTFSRGAVRKSAAVAYRGRLLGICDMKYVLDGENYKSGAYLGLYEAGGYKIGVCIENDLMFPEGVRALTSCGCNVIACITESAADFIPPMLIRAYAYLYGAPFVLCTGRAAFFAGTDGELASSVSPLAFFECDVKNSYRLVTERVRGMADTTKCDY
ncbi:MAG: hypothetical protein LUD27_03950, partial [Clostridia bacterium]|nr:hypothetical protein [Clostridia bacterium]